MFADMKEELVKQQAMINREREQAEKDREHAIHEWKEHLNNQLHTQIVVFQNTRVSPPRQETQCYEGYK